MKKPIILLIAFCVTIGSTYAQYLTGSLTNGVIANYNSENGRTATNDASGNNRNLTAVNGATIGLDSSPSGVPPFGGSLFTGINISGPVKSVFLYQNSNTSLVSNYTISAWFNAYSFNSGKSSNYSEWNYLFSSGVNSFIRIGVDPSDTPNFGKVFFNEGNGSANISSYLQSGAWMNITCTLNGTNSNIYFNGTNVSSYSAISTNDIDINNYVIGGDFHKQYNLPGELSDVVIYNRALNSNEVTSLVKAVPEPSTYALFGIGAIGVLMVLRRKKSA